MYNVLRPRWNTASGAGPDAGDLQITRGKVLAEIGAVKVFSGSMLNQLLGGKTATVLPDILPQPVKQGAEVTVGDIAFQLR